LTRGLTLEDVFKRNDCLCGACRKQLIELWTTVTVLDMRVTSIYLYTPFFENLIFQFKDAKDLPLAPLFLKPYTYALRWRLRHHVVVTVPSSPKRTAARGFVPVVSLFNAIGVNVLQPFEKDEVKQSQRSSKRDLTSSVTSALSIRMSSPVSALSLWMMCAQRANR
jgi:competence protein ComFC